MPRKGRPISTSAKRATRVHTVVPSPLGPLRLVATHGVLSGLYMQSQRHLPEEATFGPRYDAPFAKAVAQLEAYFTGERTGFDVGLHLPGTPFQQSVWAALREIPYGETRSYGELATRIGSPRASRAVGLANGRNPIAIIVPCHRVVGADGRLTGYGGGIERKRHLLDLERSHRSRDVQGSLSV